MIIILNSLSEKYWKITHVWIIDYSSSAGKELTCNTGDLSLIPALGRSPGEGIGYPLQHSWASLVAQMESTCNVGNPVWSLGWEDPLEKGTAIHSRILAWRIPWTKEPHRLQFVDSQRVKQGWATFNSHT